MIQRLVPTTLPAEAERALTLRSFTACPRRMKERRIHPDGRLLRALQYGPIGRTGLGSEWPSASYYILYIYRSFL